MSGTLGGHDSCNRGARTSSHQGREAASRRRTLPCSTPFWVCLSMPSSSTRSSSSCLWGRWASWRWPSCRRGGNGSVSPCSPSSPPVWSPYPWPRGAATRCFTGCTRAASIAKQVQHHQNMGKLVIYPTIALWVLAAALVLLDRRGRTGGSDDGGRGAGRPRCRRGYRAGGHHGPPRLDSRLELHASAPAPASSPRQRPAGSQALSSSTSRLRSSRRSDASRAGSL